jgi:imidazolonepropionase-like amidohydrolase
MVFGGFVTERNLRNTLATGITSIRDAGGADLGVKTAVETGLISGPHMQISLTMISQTGGHGDGWMPSGQYIRIFVAHPGVPDNIVNGAEEMRKKVRELVRMGADVIKVATSGGVLSPRDDPRTHISPRRS